MNDEKSGNKFISFLCCACASKRKFGGDSDIYFNDDNGPYEYLVEKLAIKKVPVSLFTLSGEFPKKPSQSSEDTSSAPSIEATPPPKLQSPAVSFSSYYKLQTTDKIDDQLSQSSKDRRSLSFADDFGKEREIVNSFLPLDNNPRKILTEKQSREMVANILNKHSSLFTLDDKDAIPKDPNHKPTNKMVIPSSVKQAVLKQQKASLHRQAMHEREVYADIHHIPNRNLNGKDSFSPNKTDMDYSIQTTIDSLKYTQKPHLPGIPPKNQRSLKNSISDSSTEKEFYCVAPILGTSDPKIFNKNVATNSKMFTNQNVKKACDYEIYYNKLHRESNDRDKYFPFHAQAKQNAVVQRFSSPWNPPPQEKNYVEYKKTKKVFTVPADDEFHGPYHLRKSEYYNPKYHEGTGDDDEDDDDESDKLKNKNKEKDKKNYKNTNNKSQNKGQNTSRGAMVDDEQITDVRPAQAQNLKWKIIVKHHQDNKSDGDASETGSHEEYYSGSLGIPHHR